MNYKEGGLWKKGDITYEASVKRSMRPYPLPGTPYGKCSKESHFGRTDFEFRGAGWATWDFGQELLLPALQRCFQGGRVVAWAFTYFDQRIRMAMNSRRCLLFKRTCSFWRCAVLRTSWLRRPGVSSANSMG